MAGSRPAKTKRGRQFPFPRRRKIFPGGPCMTPGIKRVVVPLDAASETGIAIDTAAQLAARWRVPLPAK